MRKLIQLGMIVMLAFAVFGYAIAYAQAPANTNAKERAKEIKPEILKKERFEKLKERELEKIEKLEAEKLRKLSRLEEKKIEKLAKLEEKKLEKLANIEQVKLRKLARLNEAELNKAAALDEATLQKIARLNRVEIKRLIQKPGGLNRADIDAEISRADDFREKALVRRHIGKDKLERAKADLELAKAQRMRAKDQFHIAKDEYLDIKKSLAACSGVNTEECNKTREEIKLKSQIFVLNAADAMIAELERLKSKIQASEEIPDDALEAWIAKIDAEIQKIKDMRSAAETAQTKEEIVSSAQSIKNEWLFVKYAVNRLAAMLVHKKVGAAAVKFEILEDRLEEILSQLEENGTATEEIDVLVDEFNERIAEAKSEHELAQQKWGEVADLASSNATLEDIREANSLLKEAHEHIRASHTALKEAQRILREIAKKVKEAGVNIRDENMPEYAPGKDLGYFVWQSSNGMWSICFSGDGTEHTDRGSIKADSSFAIVKPFLFERKTDKYAVRDKEIAFKSRVGLHQDCLRFGTSSTEVVFELYIDGNQTDNIFVGEDSEQYTSPATLTGIPCAKCAEPETVTVEEDFSLTEEAEE